METFKSSLSNLSFPITEKVAAKTIRSAILELIQQEYPNFATESFLSVSELNEYRQKYISTCLLKEVGELGELEKTVLATLSESQTITNRIEDAPLLTLGQKVADKIATFGGSWTFIISFITFLVIWISANAFIYHNRGFDPYPFILLNLILSCIAALQAPVIMMSQNRQEEKDRERAKKDYMINLKSELEIRILHEKIDHLIMHQQQELLEIQQIQTEMLNDILQHTKAIYHKN
ncbi:MAG: DUF1003 domain-containing protein [Chitinophagales bacterium]|nr:DUF1003 domain-containing protein [Chitinophagales bacterium]